MRIAHIESSMNWGGLELRVLEQSEWLQENGHEAHVIALPGSAMLREARQRRLPALELEMRGNANPQTIYRLLGYLKRNNIEVLNAQAILAKG